MSNKHITILGAGIVGICCALELQQAGYQVTLIDRHGFGQEASYGNAGVLSLSSVVPLASPVLLRRLLALATNQQADFLLHYPQLLSLMPWLVRFLLRCNRQDYINDGLAMSRLTLPSIEMHLAWIKQAKAGHLLNPMGALKLYRSCRTFEQGALERSLFDQCGVKHSILNWDDISQLEPHLKPIFETGVLIEETQSLKDPQALSQCYADLFLAQGGVYRQADVRAIGHQPNHQPGQWVITSDQGVESADKLLLCLGAWTPQLIKPLGYRNPIAIERGYHTVFQAQPGKSLNRPIFDADGGFVMIPMNEGLRVTTGSNLIYRDTVETPIQISRVTPKVHDAFPVDKIIRDKPWMGRRPSTPDSLPIIGPAPRHKNLWLAFGHAHMGLTVAPMTGALIAQSVARQPYSIPAEPYSPDRYL